MKGLQLYNTVPIEQLQSYINTQDNPSEVLLVIAYITICTGL